MKEDANTPEKSCCFADWDNEQIPLEKRCVGLLISANREHKCMVENLVDRSGIHRSQHQMLVMLSKSRSAPSQKELAEKLGISPAAVAVTLKKMEKNGYIERCAAESDNRYNEIRISQKGRQVLEETRHLFEKLDKAVFADFSEDDMRRFVDLMKKIKQNIRGCGSLALTEEKEG